MEEKDLTHVAIQISEDTVYIQRVPPKTASEKPLSESEKCILFLHDKLLKLKKDVKFKDHILKEREEDILKKFNQLESVEMKVDNLKEEVRKLERVIKNITGIK